jgi:hypothetical protein
MDSIGAPHAPPALSQPTQAWTAPAGDQVAYRANHQLVTFFLFSYLLSYYGLSFFLSFFPSFDQAASRRPAGPTRRRPPPPLPPLWAAAGSPTAPLRAAAASRRCRAGRAPQPPPRPWRLRVGPIEAARGSCPRVSCATLPSQASLKCRAGSCITKGQPMRLAPAPEPVALACKGPLNVRLATGVGLYFFLSCSRACGSALPRASPSPPPQACSRRWEARQGRAAWGRATTRCTRYISTRYMYTLYKVYMYAVQGIYVRFTWYGYRHPAERSSYVLCSGASGAAVPPFLLPPSSFLLPPPQTELCRSWVDTGACRYGSKCQVGRSAGAA